ncbi:MAG: hypothetical protein M1284_00640 [Candidatus Parvarchaeota archaeon]|nr:hypothetical protein [Candidatus Parvarchaeota archaeon]MCL5420244.1 hypothetical protein [Candidatus Parvarchaeota archaeon]
MEEGGGWKGLLSAVVYGLKSPSEASSFIAFMSVFLIVFLLDFVTILEVLGLGVFMGKTVYPSVSTSYIIIGEAAFISSFMLIIFSVFILFYYKLYYVVSNNLSISRLIKTSLVKFPKFLIAIFVQGAVSILGLIALVIPGVYYGSSLMFFGFFSIYGDSTVYSAFRNSRELAKGIKLQSIVSFLIYLVLLLLFVYLVSTAVMPLIYKGILGSLLLSYWVVSYSNSVFNLADRNLNNNGKIHSLERQ